MADAPLTAQQIADAAKARKALESKRDTLTKRVAHLEESIEGLPDDAAEADAQWFATELRRTQAELDVVTNRLTDIEAKVKANEIREEASAQSDLVAIYREAEKNRTVHELPDALRKRALEAVRKEGEAKLYAPR